MPTYDYICRSCKKNFEFFHSMSAPAKTDCPSCNNKSLEKQIGTGMGVFFKGSGFYETDYKKKAKNPESKPKNDSK